jgi:ribonuclease VapC
MGNPLPKLYYLKGKRKEGMESNNNTNFNIVLDSFALLAYFCDEKGKTQVEQVLEKASAAGVLLKMAVINMGEVLYITERERGIRQSQLVLSRIRHLPIKIYNIDEKLTLKAAHLKAEYPVAFSDCFAAGLAEMSGSTLMTGDPEFKKLEDHIDICWI